MGSSGSIFHKKFSNDMLVEYLINNPDRIDEFDLSKLAPYQLVKLLVEHPEFIDLCDVSKLSSTQCASVIGAHPQLFHRLPKAAHCLPLILTRQPQLISECAAPEKIHSKRWVDILIFQPQLAPYCPWEKLDSDDWAKLLTRQIGFADRCPWSQMSFFELTCRENPSQDKFSIWQYCLTAHRDVVLKYRPDWQKYEKTCKTDSYEKARLLCFNPELAEKFDMTAFRRQDWVEILMERPEFINKCQVRKTFRNVPLNLVMKHPFLADHFNWSHASLHRGHISIGTFARKHPLLVPRVLYVMRPDDWMVVVRRHPEYLLKDRRVRLSFCENARIFDEGVFPFEETGVDTICNSINQHLERVYPPPESKLAGFRNDMTSHEFMIRSIMDITTAQLFFKKQLFFTRWEFVEELHDIDPEAVHRLMPRSKVPFLWVTSAPESVWKKYLDSRGDVSVIADRNGNTLLHAALLRRLFENTPEILSDGGEQCACVRYLLERGCDPDKKNKSGVSFNDLLKIIRGKLGPLAQTHNYAV